MTNPRTRATVDRMIARRFYRKHSPPREWYERTNGSINMGPPDKFSTDPYLTNLLCADPMKRRFAVNTCTTDDPGDHTASGAASQLGYTTVINNKEGAGASVYLDGTHWTWMDVIARLWLEVTPLKGGV